MGCIRLQMGYVGDSRFDPSFQPRVLIHRYSKQRPENEYRGELGVVSAAQAEAHLQTGDGAANMEFDPSLDFVLIFPTWTRAVAMTGASGGGTQTMTLCRDIKTPALSPSRPPPAFRIVSCDDVSTRCKAAALAKTPHSEGEHGNARVRGSLCAQAAGRDGRRRLDQGHGKPWLSRTANNSMPGRRAGQCHAAARRTFPHNYNAVTRSGFYSWLNRTSNRVFRPVSKMTMSPSRLSSYRVDKSILPKAGDAEFEHPPTVHGRCNGAVDPSAATPDGFEAIRPAVETLVGRTKIDTR